MVLSKGSLVSLLRWPKLLQWLYSK